jgi:hypothetical protein
MIDSQRHNAWENARTHHPSRDDDPTLRVAHEDDPTDPVA